MSLPMMFCARHTHALISIYGRSEQCWLLVDRLEASISDDSVEGVPPELAQRAFWKPWSMPATPCAGGALLTSTSVTASGCVNPA